MNNNFFLFFENKNQRLALWFLFSYLGLHLFNSCQTNDVNRYEKVNYHFESVKEYEFINGFMTWNVRVFSENNNEFIAFADFVTEKKIVIHSITGKEEKFEIPISEVIKQGGDLGSFSIINSDSILLITAYSNNIYLINSSGIIQDQIALNTLINSDVNYNCFARRDFYSVNNHSVVTALSLEYTYSNEKLGLYSSIDEFTVESKKHAFYLKIDNFFTDSVKSCLALPNFYNRFLDSTAITLEPPRVLVLNNKIFICSNFVDTLYEVDMYTNKILSTHAISSDYTKIGYIPATRRELDEDKQKHNSLARNGGFLYYLDYDNQNQLYYAVILHENAIEENMATSTSRPWSIILYDENFEKIQEIKMDETKYGHFIINTKDGLLISTYPQKRDDNDVFEKATFELFKLVKD